MPDAARRAEGAWVMGDFILVVDDAKFARLLEKRTLRNGGYENIIEAATAKEAFELFVEKKPELVLLDITLPDNTDLTLLKKMLAENPKAKIIMNTAIGQELIIMDAMKAGAKDFIVKPFEEKAFLNTVTRVLESE